MNPWMIIGAAFQVVRWFDAKIHSGVFLNRTTLLVLKGSQPDGSERRSLLMGLAFALLIIIIFFGGGGGNSS